MIRLLTAAFLALAAAAPAEAAWREASSKHFVVYSEQSAEALRAFATRLERYDSAMRWLRNVPDEDLGPSNRLTVYVVPSIGRVQKLAGDKSGFVAGFYVPRAGGSLAIIPRKAGGGSEYDLDGETVLLHEYAHHFLYQNFGSVAYPAWFSEGFAEFNSVAKFEKDGSVGVGLPAMHRAYSLVGRTSLPIQKLLAPDLSRLSPMERDALYGRGWALTHMLTLDPGRKGQLTSYLNALNSGKSGIDAAQSAFGDLKKLDSELEKYVRQRRLTYFKIPAAEIQPSPVAIRDLTPAEAAVMAVRIRSDRGVDRKAALALLPDARRAAAPFPNDVAAQTVLAEAEYDAGNHSEAEAAADRALATDPKSVDALIYKGRARMALAEAANSTDPQVWKEVRRWFVAANKVEPNNPVPLILFYSSFEAAGAKPTANATSGLIQAYALAPQDRSLRMMAARQYLIDGKSAEARRALAPIAFDPHSGEMGAFAAAVVAKLDSEGPKAALAASETLSKETETASE